MIRHRLRDQVVGGGRPADPDRDGHGAHQRDEANRREHGGASAASGDRPRRRRPPLGGEPALERERGGVLGEAALELLGQEALGQVLARTRGAVGEVCGQRTRECDVEPPALIVQKR